MFARKLFRPPAAGTSTLGLKTSLLNNRHVSTYTESPLKVFFKSRTTTCSLSNPRYASTSTASERTLPDSERETDEYPVVPGLLQNRNFSRAQNISTLDPSRLVVSDFIDCEDHWKISVRYRRISIIFCEYARVRVQGRSYDFISTPFPPETRGYLYLHRPDGVHPCAATLRFRICDRGVPPQESFARGKDLLSLTGAPWELTMLKLFVLKCIRNFREGLLHDNMMSLEAIKQVDKLVGVVVEERKKWRKLRSKLVFSFGQSFSIPMGRLKTTFNFVNLKTNKVEAVLIRTKIAKCTEITLLYTVRLEYDPHAKHRIALRILQIPEQLQGKTLYNEGDIIPFKHYNRFPAGVVDALLPQSPSLSSFTLPSRLDRLS